MNYFQRIIDFFTTHSVSKSGQNAFHQWLIDEEHGEEKEKTLRDFWESVSNESSREIKTSLRQTKEKVAQTKRKTLWLRYRPTAAAILMMALLSAIYFYTFLDNREMPSLVEQYVPTAEIYYVTLPDGSRVQLNSRSVLLYPENFDKKSRSVYLMGEANFKVTPDADRPFIVKSSDFQVTVLGTEFDVFAYPEDSLLRATVISGSVKVEYDNLASNAILSTGQQLTYNKYSRKGLVNTPNMHDATAWQRGELVFRSTTLEEIITMLERKYPYDFSYNLAGLKDDKYTFRFGEKAPLSEVMDIITKVAAGKVRYRIENNICYIITR